MNYLIIGGVAGGATVAARRAEWMKKPISSCSNEGNMYRMQTVAYLII